MLSHCSTWLDDTDASKVVRCLLCSRETRMCGATNPAWKRGEGYEGRGKNKNRKAETTSIFILHITNSHVERKTHFGVPLRLFVHNIKWRVSA